MDYQLAHGFDGIILTTKDGVVMMIPNDIENSAWSSYQAWLHAGGTPKPAGDLSFVPSPAEDTAGEY